MIRTNKILFILYCAFSSYQLDAQSFTKSKCQYFYDSYEDDSLKQYLDFHRNKVDDSNLVHLYLFYGRYYRASFDRINQIKHLQLSLSEWKKGNHSPMLKAKILDELSIASRGYSDEQNQFALNCINESIAIKLRFPDTAQLTKSYLIKGNIFFSLSGHTKSQLDSAIYYYSVVQKMARNESYKHLASENLAAIYIELGKLDKADSVFLNVDLSRNISPEDKARKLNNLASFYTNFGEYDASASILDTLLDYTIRNKLLYAVSSSLSNKAKLADSLKNYKEASFWKDSLLSYSHNIFNQQNAEAVEKYSNERLSKEKAETELQLKKRQLWLSILGGILALLSVLAFAMYRFQNYRRRVALEKAESQALLQAAKAKMEGEQEERKVVASLLHDRVASLLTAADMQLSVAKLNTKDSSNSLEKTSDILQEVNTQVRDLSHQLVSPTLIRFGLAPALDSLCQKMTNLSIKIVFSSDIEKKRYDTQIEGYLYSSCSELINNALKHSGASRVQVNLTHSNDKLILRVNDDGKGINSKITDTGLGLLTIRNRAKSLQGNFELASTDKGTTVTISIPV